MAKILQIRRGNSAQNNNFTGLPGEISIDTDAKTLRVHDGETLGGIPLARADEIGTGGGGGENGGSGIPFDIESVSSEFWSNLFATHKLRPARFLESINCSVSSGNFYDYAFDEISADTDISQAIAVCVLVCQTPQAGYAIGDIVHSFGIGARTNPSPNLSLDSNGLHARLMIAGESFWVSHKTTGATTNITSANWKMRFRVLILTTGIESGNSTNTFDINSVPASFWQNLFSTYGDNSSGGGANINLSNLALPVKSGNISTGPDIVVEWATGLTGTNYTNGWYRKYKSGWVEQGGSLATNSTDIIFQIPMQIGYMWQGNLSKTQPYIYQNHCNNPSTNGLLACSEFYMNNTGNGRIQYWETNTRWEVKGMMA